MARSRSNTSDTPAKRLLRRVVWAAAAVGVVAFAVEGGEFGTSDILAQKTRKERLQRELDSLRAMTDSLKAELKSMNTDDARLERIARERYGMVKGTKEVLYRVPRSGDAAAARAAGATRDSVVARDTSLADPRG